MSTNVQSITSDFPNEVTRPIQYLFVSLNDDTHIWQSICS